MPRALGHCSQITLLRAMGTGRMVRLEPPFRPAAVCVQMTVCRRSVRGRNTARPWALALCPTPGEMLAIKHFLPARKPSGVHPADGTEKLSVLAVWLEFNRGMTQQVQERSHAGIVAQHREVMLLREALSIRGQPWLALFDE